MKIAMRTINLVVKRLLDLIGSGLGLVLVSPILLISALLIKITMPGPIVFRQERIGKDNRLFYILKFRTMKVDKEAESNHDISKDQERKTVMGNFLRRTKIDELPQLINVLKGDMSLVGPRPTFAEQAAAYTTFQKQRLRMRPGMTGLAQVNGNTAISWEDRIKYDVKYVRDFNVLLDIEILFKTIQVVIGGEEKFAKTMDNKVYGGMEK
ncbi:sugar transferase [Enterocloster bolteae]|uniref:sugar transferase n=1 Tax=Enterocloster bolteae TaxID=208479 RepID=UPI002A8240F9|nr:sugar transferase [Enterocloster bolteae]